MNVFAKRYFVHLCLIFLAFSRISLEYDGLKIFAIFSIICGIAFLLSRIFKLKSTKINIFLILSVFAVLLGCMNTQMNLFKNESIINQYSGSHTISGYIKEDISKEVYASEQIMRVENVDGKKTGFDIVLLGEYQTEFSHGDFIEIRVDIFELEDYENLQFVKSNNKYKYPLASIISEDVEIKFNAPQSRIDLVLSKINSDISYKLKYMIGKNSGAFASALLLGNREELSDSTLRDFRRAGVYHMLALSGMHVAILFGIIEFLLKKCLVPKWIRIVLIVISSIFYLGLTGFSPSTCRAIIMLFAVYMSFILEKTGDSMTFLFGAIFLIVLFDPTSVVDIGLLLSFLSTFGVLVAIQIKSKIKFLREEKSCTSFVSVLVGAGKNILFLLLTTLCVFVATLPILCIYFGEVSLMTFFTNLFIGAICEIFMILAIVTLIFIGNVQVWQFFAQFTNNIGEFILLTVKKISDIENIVFSLNYPGTKILVFGLFAFSIFLLSIKLIKKWLVAIPVVAFAILMCINVIGYNASIDNQVTGEFIAGDSLVLSSNKGVYLCDASNGRYVTLAEGYKIAKENCFTELDGVVLTHYHSRYVVSLQQLSSNCKLRELYLPMPQNSDEGDILAAISRVLDDENVQIFIYQPSNPINILSGELVVSNGIKVESSAHPSIAFTYSYNESRITVIERPYFDTYLESSGAFEKYISESDLLIFGSDGKKLNNSFEIFQKINSDTEVCFVDYYMLELSDFEKYMHDISISFDIEYKKIILK